MFRLSSHQSQPWAPETKGNIHQELFSPVRSPGSGEEADREAAYCKTRLGLGWVRKEGRIEQDSHGATVLLTGGGMTQPKMEVLPE